MYHAKNKISGARSLAVLSLVGLALALAVMPAAAVAQDAGQKAQDESLSPSQESLQRINALRANEFFYQSYGKDDPFRVLVDGDYEQVKGAELVDMNSAQLVGVMWGEEDRFALVEDGEGFGYILRVGDRVRYGRVVSIRKQSLTARVTLYGITSKVVLKLEKTEG